MLFTMFYELMLIIYIRSMTMWFYEQYTEIWDLDENDPFSRPEGGESVNDVASRLERALATMESQFQG